MIKELDKPFNKKNLLENYKKILYLMTPLIPHFTSECLQDLKDTDEKKWPKADKRFLTKENVDIVVQINGKKRSLINVIKGTKENTIIMKIKGEENLKKFLENKKIIRSIFVENRIINLIVKDE